MQNALTVEETGRGSRGGFNAGALDLGPFPAGDSELFAARGMDAGIHQPGGGWGSSRGPPALPHPRLPKKQAIWGKTAGAEA